MKAVERLAAALDAALASLGADEGHRAAVREAVLELAGELGDGK